MLVYFLDDRAVLLLLINITKSSCDLTLTVFLSVQGDVWDGTSISPTPIPYVSTCSLYLKYKWNIEKLYFLNTSTQIYTSIDFRPFQMFFLSGKGEWGWTHTEFKYYCLQVNKLWKSQLAGSMSVLDHWWIESYFCYVKVFFFFWNLTVVHIKNDRSDIPRNV